MLEHAARVESATVEQILDSVEECSALTPPEKETIVRFGADEECAHVYTERASIMKRLLCHPDFDVTELRVCSAGDSHPPYGRSVCPSEYEKGAVTGIRGRLPIGCLKVSGSARNNNHAVNVVARSVLDNDPRDSEGDGGNTG